MFEYVIEDKHNEMKIMNEAKQAEKIKQMETLQNIFINNNGDVDINENEEEEEGFDNNIYEVEKIIDHNQK